MGKGQPSGFHAGKIEHVLDDAHQVLAGLANLVQIILLPGRQWRF